MNELLRLDGIERPLRRRLAAIAFLDVAGYSRLMAVNEDATLHAWSVLRHTVIEPRIITARGRIVDRAGDGIFAEFGSALEALSWAIDTQNAVARHPHPNEPIRLRIAVHLADVIDGPDGEIYGDGVNTAARLQSYAEVGGVIVSQAVVDAVQGKTEAVFTDLGLLNLKNLGFPVHAFRLGTAATAPAPHPPMWQRTARAGVGVVALALLLLGVAAHWASTPREQAERLLQQGQAIACPAFPCPGQWLAQRDLFQQAIAADPTFAKAYAAAALTYTLFVSSRLSTDSREDLRAAERLADKAVALAPEQAFTQDARAAVLRQDPDKLEEALAAYQRVLAIEPNKAGARANAGWLLLLLGRPAEAELYVQAALKADPGNVSVPAWLERMGLAEMFLDHNGHGADYFRGAIARQSQIDAMTDYGQERAIELASALALNGEVEAARDVIADLRRQYPSLSMHNLWNTVCAKSSRFKLGVEQLRKGAALAGVIDPG